MKMKKRTRLGLLKFSWVVGGYCALMGAFYCWASRHLNPEWFHWTVKYAAQVPNWVLVVLLVLGAISMVQWHRIKKAFTRLYPEQSYKEVKRHLQPTPKPIIVWWIITGYLGSQGREIKRRLQGGQSARQVMRSRRIG